MLWPNGMTFPRSVRAGLLGSESDEIPLLLSQVLGELSIEAEVRQLQGRLDARECDLAVVLVDPPYGDLIEHARGLLDEGTPLLAILPANDDALAMRVLARGASAYYAKDTPRQRLRAVLLALLGDRLSLRRTPVA